MRSVAPRLGYSWLNLSPQLQSPGKRRQQTLGSDLFVTSTKTAIHLSANDDVGSSPQNWLTSVQLRIHKDPFTVPWIGTIQGGNRNPKTEAGLALKLTEGLWYIWMERGEVGVWKGDVPLFPGMRTQLWGTILLQGFRILHWIFCSLFVLFPRCHLRIWVTIISISSSLWQRKLYTRFYSYWVFFALHMWWNSVRWNKLLTLKNCRCVQVVLALLVVTLGDVREGLRYWSSLPDEYCLTCGDRRMMEGFEVIRVRSYNGEGVFRILKLDPVKWIVVWVNFEMSVRCEAHCWTSVSVATQSSFCFLSLESVSGECLQLCSGKGLCRRNSILRVR